jgi:hypothetical protein
VGASPFMDTPPLSAAMQVALGGAWVFITGIRIGNSQLLLAGEASIAHESSISKLAFRKSRPPRMYLYGGDRGAKFPSLRPES